MKGEGGAQGEAASASNVREQNRELLGLETDLLKITGVLSARVVGQDAPSEIHVVATPNRPPKQVVRDVQSLAAARFGISIDHRIVSVVQLGEEAYSKERATVAPPTHDVFEEEARRPLLDRVVFASKGNTGWVKAALQWPDGELTEGADVCGATRESRGRAAAIAVQRALEGRISKRNAVLDIEEVLIQRLGSDESVTVRAVIHEQGNATQLVGSALIYDDIATASVHATLHALNRKLA